MLGSCFLQSTHHVGISFHEDYKEAKDEFANLVFGSQPYAERQWYAVTLTI